MSIGLLIVEVAELIAAANEMNQASQIYEEAVENAKSAAADLASKWEGAAKDAFVVHQENAYNWHKQIINIVVQIINVIRKAAEQYEQMQAALRSTMEG